MKQWNQVQKAKFGFFHLSQEWKQYIGLSIKKKKKKNLSQQIFEEVDYIIMTPHFTTWNLTSWWFWLITELSSR